MKEIWKDIEGFEGLYQISNLGRVKSLERKVKFGSQTRIIKSNIRKLKSKKSGYLFIQFRKNGKEVDFHVHRLVAMAFCDGYFNGADVIHKDGNKKNNIYTNLEWCTRSQNQIHAYRILKRSCYARGKFGKLSNRSIPVLQLTLKGDLVKAWDSITLAEKGTGIPFHSISKCAHGLIPQSHGFIWKLKNTHNYG